jgi:cyclopropane fatty-acyl-phospholipid synthase-like methyltransferase
MPLLSRYSRRMKCRWFFRDMPLSADILEVGCGAGWLKQWLAAQGWLRYTGLDLHPPADITGDVRDWPALGLARESFDVIVAFEVVEHVDCFQALWELLRPAGRLMLTSPVPERDWICRLLETAGLAQQRTSPHSRLIDFRVIPGFEAMRLRRVAMLAQWGVFRKTPDPPPAGKASG